MEHEKCVMCLVKIHIPLCSATVWGSYMIYDDKMHYVLFSANDMGITLVTVCLYVYLHLYEKNAWFNFNLDDHLIACKLIFYTHLYVVEYACIYMKCMVDLRLINISSNISHRTSKIFI